MSRELAFYEDQLTQVDLAARPSQFSRLSDEVKNDEAFIFLCLQRGYPIYKFLSDKKRGDKSILLAALSADSKQIGYSSDGEHEGSTSSDLPARILFASRPSPLKYASKALQNDEEVVLAAVTNNHSAFRYANDCFKCNKAIVLIVVANCGYALSQVHHSLQDDKVVVLAAVNNNVRAFKFASYRVKKDRSLVLFAAKNGCSIEYIPEDFLSDKDVVLAAMKSGASSGWGFERADDTLKNDRSFVLNVVSYCGEAFRCLPMMLRSDKEVALLAVTRYIFAFRYVGEVLKDDFDVVIAAVSRHGQAIKHASDRLKRDKRVIYAALGNDGTVINTLDIGVIKQLSSRQLFTTIWNAYTGRDYCFQLSMRVYSSFSEGAWLMLSQLLLGLGLSRVTRAINQDVCVAVFDFLSVSDCLALVLVFYKHFMRDHRIRYSYSCHVLDDTDSMPDDFVIQESHFQFKALVQPALKQQPELNKWGLVHYMQSVVRLRLTIERIESLSIEPSRLGMCSVVSFYRVAKNAALAQLSAMQQDSIDTNQLTSLELMECSNQLLERMHEILQRFSRALNSRLSRRHTHLSRFQALRLGGNITVSDEMVQHELDARAHSGLSL